MIGVAGCGRMGAPMLAALRAAGFDAQGFDVRPTSDFGPLKPIITNDAAHFAANLETLISVVRDIPPHITLIDAPMPGVAIAAQERRLFLHARRRRARPQPSPAIVRRHRRTFSPHGKLW